MFELIGVCFMETLTCDQIRQIDHLAIKHLAIPGVVLMENAGRGAAGVVKRLIRRRLKLAMSDTHIAIVCGGGNNAGDGYVMARHLAAGGCQVCVYAAKDPQLLRGDAAINAAIVRNIGLPVRTIYTEAELMSQCGEWDRAHVLVDALLGTGFHGVIRHQMLSIIERINASAVSQVVAVDIPSGLHGDTGDAVGAAVCADVTVTFVAPKTGFQMAVAKRYLGRVVVVGIGIPSPWLARVTEGYAQD